MPAIKGRAWWIRRGLRTSDGSNIEAFWGAHQKQIKRLPIAISAFASQNNLDGKMLAIDHCPKCLLSRRLLPSSSDLVNRRK